MPPTIEQARLLSWHMEFLRYDLLREEATVLNHGDTIRGQGHEPCLRRGWRQPYYRWLATSLPDQFEYNSSLTPMIAVRGGSYAIPEAICEKLGITQADYNAIFLGMTPTFNANTEPCELADEIEKIVSPILDRDGQTLKQLRMLEKLSQFLVKKVPAEHFNIDRYLSGDVSLLPQLLEKPDRDCKTAACAVGWLPIVHPSIFHYREDSVRVSHIIATGHDGRSTGSNAKEALGLSDANFHNLFMPHSYRNNVPPEVVGEKIGRFVIDRLRLKYGDWPRDWYPDSLPSKKVSEAIQLVEEESPPAPAGVLSLNKLFSRIRKSIHETYPY